MLLHLDFTIDIPIYQQIRNEIVRGIAAGSLPEGELLPPIRTLAEDLGVNMMTVSKAYTLLKQEGYIQTDRRAGTRICTHRQADMPAELRQKLELVISEAKITGIDLEKIVSVCRTVYEGGTL